MSSLVIQTSFLGDVVLTTPLLAELAARGPVDVVVTPAAAPLLANHPAVRDVLVFDKRGADDGMAGLWRFARGAARARATARRARPPSRTSRRARCAARRSRCFAGIRERVGIRFLGRPRALHPPLAVSRRAAITRSGSGGSRRATTRPIRAPEVIRPRLYPGETERAAVDALLKDVPRDGARLFALAPGSIWGTKRWPHYAGPRLATRAALPAGGDRRAGRRGARRGDRARRGTRARHRRDRQALAARVDGAARALRGARHERFGAAAPRVGRRHADARRSSARPCRSSASARSRRATRSIGHETLACRPCHPHGPAGLPARPLACMRELDVEQVSRALDTLLLP